MMMMMKMKVEKKNFFHGFNFKFAKEAVKVPEKRGELVRKLEYAIQDVFELAKNAPASTEKPSARPDKLRYYDLMADMIKVLDDVLENVAADQLEEKLEKLEARLNEFEASEHSNADQEENREGGPG